MKEPKIRHNIIISKDHTSDYAKLFGWWCRNMGVFQKSRRSSPGRSFYWSNHPTINERTLSYDKRLNLYNRAYSGNLDAYFSNMVWIT